MKTLGGKPVALFVALLCVAYLGYRIYASRSDAAEVRDETLEEATSTVAVVSPKAVPATETMTLPGNIVGWYEAPIYARVTGYVKMWYKVYGDRVKKGDVLAEISTPDLDAEYRQATADLRSERAKYRLAEVTAKRWLALRPNHAVSEQSITVQEQHLRAQAAAVEAAEEKVKNIEAFIGFKKIIAPFDGVVIQRNINVGDLVSKEGTLSTPSAKTNLYTVAIVDMLRLFVKVPETFGHFLQPGLTADVTVPQLPKRHFTAAFLTVAGGFDLGTRTAATIFTIDNKDHALWPGSYAQVTLTAPIDRQAFTIPSTALVYQQYGTQVAVVTEDNRVHFNPVTVTQLMDNAVEVAGGLSTSDRVINNPNATLLEGDPVRIVTPRPGYDLINVRAAQQGPESTQTSQPPQGPPPAERSEPAQPQSGTQLISPRSQPEPSRHSPQALQRIQP
ncbi:MAG: putative Co/Zn/Cd efflux system membrane fusion protein [Nitrospira sp.]|jgi:RND family efflux transporter MFP subunit|nr:MAG: putative Co/Zn/Cd efflux system membrane fusion protein [Nitrospira sp.]